MSEETPLTHDAWQSHWRNGRFVKWVIQGEGRIEIDSKGNAVSHTYFFGTARGDNGHTILMPKGMTPPTPQSHAKRPAPSPATNDDDEF
jgi:hypothetical protein